MSRRTHYIPVGNLVLDGVSIDPEIYCPANGYPDPTAPETLAQYCPAGGYYDPAAPLEYIPDPNMPPTPEPGSGEIILICTTALDAAVNLRTYTTTGQATYNVYGADDTLVHTQNVNSGTQFFYQFPSTGGISLTSGLQGFKIIITPVTGSLKQFQCYAKSGYAPLGWPILEAHIKCPALETAAAAFENQKYIQLIKFYGPCDSLTSCATMAKTTENLLKCVMPSSLNSLNTLSEAFMSSNVETIEFPSTMPALGNAYRAFYLSRIKTNPFENISILPLVVDIRSMMASCPELRGVITLPEMPNITNMTWLMQLSKKVTKIVFQGVMNGIITSQGAQFIAKGCDAVTEIIMPNEMTGVQDFAYTFNEIYNLKKLVFPSKLTLSTLNFQLGNTLGQQPQLEEIVFPTIFSYTGGVFELTYSPSSVKKITQFNFPAVKPTLRVMMYNSTSNHGTLTHIYIDWSEVTGDINITYNQFEAAEIERISALLPTIPALSSKFYCGMNPCWPSSGTPGFDYTIAQAKGWDVWLNTNMKGF